MRVETLLLMLYAPFDLLKKKVNMPKG